MNRFSKSGYFPLAFSKNSIKGKVIFTKKNSSNQWRNTKMVRVLNPGFQTYPRDACSWERRKNRKLIVILVGWFFNYSYKLFWNIFVEQEDICRQYKVLSTVSLSPEFMHAAGTVDHWRRMLSMHAWSTKLKEMAIIRDRTWVWAVNNQISRRKSSNYVSKWNRNA